MRITGKITTNREIVEQAKEFDRITGERRENPRHEPPVDRRVQGSRGVRPRR